MDPAGEPPRLRQGLGMQLQECRLPAKMTAAEALDLYRWFYPNPRPAADAGANGFLLKDTRRADLVRAVRDVAAGRPVLAPQALAALTGQRHETALTPRELEVLRVIAAGGTNRLAAQRLMVSEATVKTHLLHAYEQLGVGDGAAAVRVASERNLL